MTKLYQVPNNTYIKLGNDCIFFLHIDGAYSLCYYRGRPVHLSASTEVTIVPIDQVKDVDKYDVN